MFSGVTGGIVSKELLVRDLRKDIFVLKDGWQEYEDQCKLLLARKAGYEKKMKEHVAWCENFDALIGPFEAQYDACKVRPALPFAHKSVEWVRGAPHPTVRASTRALTPARPARSAGDGEGVV